MQTTNPDGSVIKATFNAQGQKVSETNQLDDTRTFEYDAQGRLTKVIMPKAKTTDLSNPVYGCPRDLIDAKNAEAKPQNGKH